MAHSIGEDLGKILDDYAKEVRDEVKKDIQQAAKATAKELRATSPKQSGDYARNWSVKQQGAGWVVYNKAPTYRLTHLLEKGHVIRNQSGTYGRAPAQPHIEPAEKKAVEDLVRKIEEDLSK